jgi:hypothetical protein
VTGSRDWDNEQFVADALDHVAEHWPIETWTLVHGACPTGADQIADAWAKQRGVPVERHPANWGRYGRKAGMQRNTDMVEMGAAICVAFLRPCAKRGCQEPQPHGSHGTVDCSTKASAAHIMVWTHRDGWGPGQ